MSAQTVHQVEAGDNAIGDALLDAVAGDIIELTTSGGVYTDSATLSTEFDITIRAAEGLAAKPIIQGNADNTIFDIVSGGLNIQGVKIMSGYYAIAVHAAEGVTSEDFNLRVDDCIFEGWASRAIYSSDATASTLDSVLVTNSIFDGKKLGEQGIYLKRTLGGSGILPGAYRYCKVENCLFINIQNAEDGHPTYIEPGDRTNSTDYPELLINHCTVDSCTFGLFAYCFPGALITNCVVTNLTPFDPANPQYAYGVKPAYFTGAPPNVVENSIYSHGVLYLSSEYATNVFTNVDSVTAQYNDAANGDYSLVAGTAGTGEGTDGKDLGYIGPASTLPVIASPGFEEDTSFLAWTTDWEASSINEDADFVFSGSKSLKIGPQGGRGQYVNGYTPGTTISLLAWGKSDAVLDEHAYIGFRATDWNGIDLLEVDSRVDGVTTINPDGWTRLCATMTVPEETAEMLVYFWSSAVSEGGQSVYTDDYEFKFGDSCKVETDVKEIKYNSFVNVYPNPTEGRFYVSMGKDITAISSIEIFDVTGKLVSRLSNLNGRENVEVDLSSYSAGVYFGMVKTQSTTYSFKIIRK
jgi:hypothetical protein